MEFTRERGFEYAQVTSVLYKTEGGENVTGKFVFRKQGEKVQVLVSKEIESPEFAENFQPIFQRMQDFKKPLKNVTMETRIKVLNEYWEEDPSATIVLKGWKEELNNRERFALERVTLWV